MKTKTKNQIELLNKAYKGTQLKGLPARPMELSKGQARFSDLDNEIILYLDYQGQNSLVNIPANKCKDGDIVNDNDNIFIESGNSKIPLQKSSQELPLREFLNCLHQTKCKASDLLQAINFVLPAVSKYDYNNILGSIHFDTDIVATDGNRLHIAPNPFDLGKFSFDLPATKSHLLTKFLIPFLKASNDDVTISIFKENVEFSSDLGSVSLRKSSGTYPNYKFLIPTKYKHELYVNPVNMINGINSVKHTANEITNLLKIHASDFKSLELSTSAVDLGQSSATVASDIVTFDDIYFNYHYLLDAFNVFKSLKYDHLKWVNNGHLTPNVISSNDNDFMILVMPIKHEALSPAAK
jgi:DNA polymerase III sliding clamp (beta) subunit (PCNA family)